MDIVAEQNNQKIGFHSYWTNQVKKELNATYVGWEESSGKFSLKVNLLDINLKKRTVLIPISGMPYNTTSAHYEELIEKFHAKI